MAGELNPGYEKLPQNKDEKFLLENLDFINFIKNQSEDKKASTVISSIIKSSDIFKKALVDVVKNWEYKKWIFYVKSDICQSDVSLLSYMEPTHLTIEWIKWADVDITKLENLKELSIMSYDDVENLVWLPHSLEKLRLLWIRNNYEEEELRKEITTHPWLNNPGIDIEYLYDPEVVSIDSFIDETTTWLGILLGDIKRKGGRLLDNLKDKTDKLREKFTVEGIIDLFDEDTAKKYSIWVKTNPDKEVWDFLMNPDNKSNLERIEKKIYRG